MAIQLSKGQRIDLTKSNPDLTRAIIGLGWDTNKYSGGEAFDLDASAFLTGSDGRCTEDLDFVFYNNLEHPSKSVIHSGDNRTGEGAGDDEQLIVDFSKIPSTIDKIAITVTIHDAERRNQNFGQVSNAFVRLESADTNEELLRFDLGEDFSIETAVVFCELYRHGQDWKFSAVGSGFSGGLSALCKNFGLEV
ncbi:MULTISPECIES: TerD family protein [Bacillus]|uniref:Chemical-damaging agent resistance protein C n=2 Tax=Bacillus TaxID=1386 RepID=A0A0M4FU29_9BACI|nr:MULTISPECIES: TerD family protein [Bacillus]ALC83660.1 chemical-damaging agent resistance protein C [Bacillus gobiensis]MBP1082683.1 tellurium resistance protein TerD [Bacillus capparidis]MED1097092.1 TerD family protein [Bacillus capparidis]